MNRKYKVGDGETKFTSRGRFLRRLEEIESQTEIIKEKLAFLEETNQENFDENEFKVYKTLKTIEEEDLTIYEKSKKIAELLKQ